MITSRFALGLTVLGALWASAAGAQTPATSSSSAASDSTLRLATNTADGDTGLWYVPTAEILARGVIRLRQRREGRPTPLSRECGDSSVDFTADRRRHADTQLGGDRP